MCHTQLPITLIKHYPLITRYKVNCSFFPLPVPYLFLLQVVTIKAVSVLCTMAKATGSFMYRRVIKDTIPSMTAFLDKQASVSLKAGPVYSQSQSFKQQLAVLKGLGRLCKQLEIGEATLCSVVWVCTQYLSSRQPKLLQQVCGKSTENSQKQKLVRRLQFLKQE